jgi:glucose/arabinose dehydrogenase
VAMSSHHHRTVLTTIGVMGLLSLWIAPIGQGQSRLPLENIKLPPGFTISLFAEGIQNPREMTLSPSGILYVGTQEAGNVYALPDRNKDNKADQVIAIALGLNAPNGVAFKDGALYIAETNRILRIDDIESMLNATGAGALGFVGALGVVYDRLPSDREHGWRFMRFGPDGLLYLPVGAPCNICEPDPTRYAGIFRMKPDGTGFEPFAQGVRNTVGFDWHPDTKELWFTDNGRDLLGDELPSDELNHAPMRGMNFGYPYCHQGDIADPQLGAKRKCAEFTPPAYKLGPHVAAIGMRFYTGSSFPSRYRNQIFIAQHGSWNRTPGAGPVGYRVMVAHLDAKGEKVVSYETFADGWLQGARAWGRPVDVLVMPDGALLVSDDTGNAIYRIAYGK